MNNGSLNGLFFYDDNRTSYTFSKAHTKSISSSGIGKVNVARQPSDNYFLKSTLEVVVSWAEPGHSLSSIATFSKTHADQALFYGDGFRQVPRFVNIQTFSHAGIIG